MTDGRRMDSTGNTEPRCCKKYRSYIYYSCWTRQNRIHSSSSVPGTHADQMFHSSDGVSFAVSFSGVPLPGAQRLNLKARKLWGRQPNFDDSHVGNFFSPESVHSVKAQYYTTAVKRHYAKHA